MVYLRYPANIPNLPGHSWANGVSMATPIAHKGSTAGAKVQAMTALDFQLKPELVKDAWEYFRSVQTKDVHYESFLAPDDKPAIELNKEKMEKFLPELKKYYFDRSEEHTSELQSQSNLVCRLLLEKKKKKKKQNTMK